MAIHRKRFRIEGIGNSPIEPASAIDADAALRHYEVMTELKAMRTRLDAGTRQAPQTVAPIDPDIPEADRLQIKEVQKLKSELDLIHAAINRTKHEIATLHVTGFQGPQMVRVTNELDAVVAGTEQATERILKAAEDIDQSANTLSAALKADYEQRLVNDIQDHVIKIFEACNFQDLTGQRITKVVATLQFIETHVIRMMEIWGGIDAFRDFAPDARSACDGDRRFLNGPRLASEPGHASQDDIDALFK
jgi:chemotaxis protein CheZ